MRVSRKEACFRQIQAAIKLYEWEDFDCAITLASAAEGMLPPTDDFHFAQIFKQDWKGLDPNLFSNWLKHDREPEELEIEEYEAALMIMRAITKFIAVYHQSSRRLESFRDHAADRGYFPKPKPLP